MDATVTGVAAQLHENWRASRRLPDGGFEPRWKDDGAGASLDIANTEFADLPHRWQLENLAAAEAALVAVRTTDSLEAASDLIHRGWLARNGALAPADQQLPYADLSEAEKEKDRVVARIAAAAAGITLT